MNGKITVDVKTKKKSKVYYSFIEEDGNSLCLRGKYGKYEFEHEIEIMEFPSEKVRDEAYRVWVESFVNAVKINSGLLLKFKEKKVN